MTNLEPCPFCGEVPEVDKSMRYPGNSNGIIGYTVVCKNLDCIGYMADGWYRRSEKAAARAWNTRYKRTCHPNPIYEYVFECDQCGGMCTDGVPKFCPECGAEVIDD